jgi:hypothetical protein
MFRIENIASRSKTAILIAALLACSRGMLAQHGGTAGRGGESGGGLSGPAGIATGVSDKDDLKNFHAALAVQATKPQIIQYASMVKSTDTAAAQLRSILELLSKNNAGELTSRGATLDQAINQARTASKKFLDGFSDQQKNGLKEIIRRLGKADSDLEQQTRVLDQAFADGKSVAQQISGSAENLDHTLTSFRSQQTDLGEEMSIAAADSGRDPAFSIPQVKSSITFAHQAIAITTLGAISRGLEDGGQNTFKLELTADLADLQLNMTGVLRAQLNKADRCGEQITIQTAALTPAAPASLVVVGLHYERWACFGRDTMNEMAEGNGTIELKLTPAVAEDGTLQLTPQIGRINAQGLVGDLLRSGSLGDAVRDTVAHTVISTVLEGENFKATLPATAQGYATLRHVEFQGTGSGKLLAVMHGEIRVPDEKATALISELQGRASSQTSQSQPQSQSPKSAQETVPR